MTIRNARAARAILVTVLSLALGSPVQGQDAKAAPSDVDAAERVMRLTPAEIVWTAGPPMLPPGASMAVLEGSFSKPGPFTVRLKFPANYRIPAHWHPVKVTVTVISGTFNMGLGDELDTANGKMLPAGSIFEMPATIHHFGWTSEETIIQEHGIGPLSVNYLSPAHAPRHR
jgi:quercetin dioxygenase-like cupin family protein